MYINKMKNDLYAKGYSKEMIEDALSNIEYKSDAFEKDFDKAVKKYKDDKNKIIMFLVRKGYDYNEIKNKLNE